MPVNYTIMDIFIIHLPSLLFQPSPGALEPVFVGAQYPQFQLKSAVTVPIQILEWGVWKIRYFG